MVNLDSNTSAIWVTPQLAAIAVTLTEFPEDDVSNFLELFSFDCRIAEIEHLLVLF